VEDELNKMTAEKIGAKFSEIRGKISKLEEQVSNVSTQKMNERIFETNARISKLQDEVNKMSGLNVNGKNELGSKISKIEEQVHVLSSRPKEVRSPVYEEQMKELLEKLIFLETRVNVLETNISEPRRLEPIILE
jgi:predicted  nucleic acid-binding Zn-ribbon protein